MTPDSILVAPAWRMDTPCQPVLALHAAASSSGQWEGLADYLSSSYRVSAPDLPGYGNAPACRSSRIGAASELIASRIAGKGEPVHLVGHSLGASVALEIAIARPDLVRSLFLIEPMALQMLITGDESDAVLFREVAELAAYMAMAITRRDQESAMRCYVDFWYGAGAWNRTSLELKIELTSYAQQTSVDLGASLANTQLVRRLSAIRCPTLLVMALNSPLASLRVTELTAQAIPGARLLMVPDAGHMAPLTDPHVINPLVRRHVRSASPAENGPALSRLPMLQPTSACIIE